MFIINSIFISLVFISIFTLIYFSIEKLFSSKKVIKIGIPTEVFNLVFGFSMGILTLLAQYIIDNSNYDNYIFFLIFSVVLLSFFKNWKISLYSLSAPIVYLIATSEITNRLYFQMIIIFIVILFTEITKLVLKENYRLIATASLLFLMAIFSLPFAFLSFFDGPLINNLEATTFSYIWSIIIFLIFSYFIKFSISSKILFESSNYSFLDYYRPSLADKAISNSIKKNSINEGILLIFEIGYNNKELKDVQVTELRETVLENISNSLKNNEILFFAPDDRFGAFIPISSFNNNLKELIKLKILKIPKRYMTSWNMVEEINIKAGASIYGLHNSSIEDLVKYSTFALNTMGIDDQVNLFSSKSYLKSIDDRNNMLLMDKNITLDDYKNEFFELWDIRDEVSPWGIRAKVESVSEFSWRETIDDRIYYKNWNQIFTRYFSRDALKNIKNIRILIDYDLSIFEHDFDSEDFIDQLKKLSITSEKVFLVIKKISLTKINNIDLIGKNISLLKKSGVNFVIENKASPKIIFNIFLDVKYVLVGNDKVINYPKAIQINDNITTVNDFNFAHKNAQIIGGRLIKAQFEFKKFDKQSKIYIEDLSK